MPATATAAALLLSVALHIGPTIEHPATGLSPANNNTTMGNCGTDSGWHVCHFIVFHRKYVKSVMSPAAGSTASGITTVVTAACAATAGPPGGALCAIITGAMASWSTAAFSQAAAQNQCVSIDHDPTGTASWYATYDGPLCKD